MTSSALKEPSVERVVVFVWVATVFPLARVNYTVLVFKGSLLPFP